MPDAPGERGEMAVLWRRGERMIRSETGTWGRTGDKVARIFFADKTANTGKTIDSFHEGLDRF
jgi:hypothetical protein